MKNNLWLIWKDPQERRRYTIGELSCNNDFYVFKYLNPELKEAIKAGFEYFPGFPNLNTVYENSKLFANIETRLPNSSRNDYLDILNSYNLNADSTKIEILKKTKGRLLTDTFEFVPIFDKSKIEFEIAGTRHYNDVKKIQKRFNVNDSLLLEIEPNNSKDERAIKVMCIKSNTKYHLGYVPRFYSKYLFELLKENKKYSAKIESLNFNTKNDDENISASVKLIFNVE